MAGPCRARTSLERGLDAIPDGAPGHDLVPRWLYRTALIEADLDHLTDGHWREREHLTPATAAYVHRIERAASFPPGLVAHAWLRYLGNVGGRDVLRRLVTAITDAGPDGRGLAFTDHSHVGDDLGPFFRDFHARLDASPWIPTADTGSSTRAGPASS